MEWLQTTKLLASLGGLVTVAGGALYYFRARPIKRELGSVINLSTHENVKQPRNVEANREVITTALRAKFESQHDGKFMLKMIVIPTEQWPLPRIQEVLGSIHSYWHKHASVAFDHCYVHHKFSKDVELLVLSYMLGPASTEYVTHMRYVFTYDPLKPIVTLQTTGVDAENMAALSFVHVIEEQGVATAC